MQVQQSIKVLLLTMIFVASGWSSEAAEIELRASAVASGTVVRLGDIARVQHEDPAIAAEWQQLPLFPAPAEGKTRQVKHQELAQLLAFSDERLAGCRLTGAAAVQIRSADAAARDTTTVTQTAYRPAAKSQHVATSAVHTESITPQASVAHIGSLDAAAASTNSVQAVVALRRFDRGDVIRREDVVLRQVSAEQIETGSLNELNAVIGREVTQAVQPNALILAKMVQKPRLVRRGETVTISSIAAGIRVITSGKAREDGSEGSLVQVDLDESNERIAARVVGLQQVEVYAGGPRVPTQKTLPTAADKE